MNLPIPYMDLELKTTLPPTPPPRSRIHEFDYSLQSTYYPYHLVLHPYEHDNSYRDISPLSDIIMSYGKIESVCLCICV